MPVNLTRLNAKLGALQARDVDAIVAAQPRLPFLNSPYNATQLRAWLNKRIDRLQTAAGATEAEVLALRQTLYNSLTVEGKLYADKILAREPYILPDTLSGADYDRLVGIILLVFIID